MYSIIRQDSNNTHTKKNIHCPSVSLADHIKFSFHLQVSKKENLAETTRDILLYVMRDLSHKVLFKQPTCENRLSLIPSLEFREKKTTTTNQERTEKKWKK